MSANSSAVLVIDTTTESQRSRLNRGAETWRDASRELDEVRAYYEEGGLSILNDSSVVGPERILYGEYIIIQDA